MHAPRTLRSEDNPAAHAAVCRGLRLICASDVVLSGFMRIVTNPRIFDPSTPMDTALAFCERLVEWPRASLITPSHRHWHLFTGLCRDIKGPLVADAYIAALAIEHGCELVTTDSAFARFPGLRWRHPLVSPCLSVWNQH